MRIRLPVGRVLFFVCAFLFTLVALLPLRLALDWLALDESGFSAREANGSIWLGTLSEAQLGAVSLGDLQASLNSLPLFVGRARVDLERINTEDPFRVAITVSRHGLGIDDASGSLELGSLAGALPQASLDLGDVSARFGNGTCTSAEGTVRASLRTNVAGLGLAGGLSGTARCSGGMLLLPLVSQTGMEGLNIRLSGDGRYTLELVVRPTDDALRQRLAGAGFTPSGAGYVLATSGRF